jgi:hypothetical protein
LLLLLLLLFAFNQTLKILIPSFLQMRNSTQGKYRME